MEDKKPEKKGFARWNWLLNLCPAALVTVLVAAMIPTADPVLREIPQLLPIHADAAGQENETEAESESQAKGDFEDGVYKGSGTGYGGTITVQVTVKDHSITSVEILSAPGETASFMKRAEAVIERVIQNQSWEVDVVSGATYSSNGILAAIQNALTGETVVTETAPVPETEELVKEVFEEPDGYQDGTYYGSARGFGGTIQVKVVISDGKIAKIAIVDASAETPSYMTSAKAVVNRILNAQSPNVDTVSGATYSSNGIINAVKAALRQAGGSKTTEDLKEDTKLPDSAPVPSKPSKKPSVQTGTLPSTKKGYVDGVYEGTAEGFGGDITVQVRISDGKIALIEIVSAEDETPSYFEDAKAVIGRIVKAQNLEVDIVSGATYSSVGIINAVADALKQAVPKEDDSNTPGNSGLEEKPGDSESNGDSNNKPGGDQSGNDGNQDGQPGGDAEDGEGSDDGSEQPAATYQDGIYHAQAICSDDDMFTYTVEVAVSVEAGMIQNIQVEKINDQSDDPESNDSYMEYAINGRTRKGVWYEGVVKQILDRQNAEQVDVVSRATYSSNAIAEAVRTALKEAVKLPETPAEDEGQENPDVEQTTEGAESPDVEEGAAGAAGEESPDAGQGTTGTESLNVGQGTAETIIRVVWDFLFDRDTEGGICS